MLPLFIISPMCLGKHTTYLEFPTDRCVHPSPREKSLGLTFSGASQVALVVKNPPANAGDVTDLSSIPESGRSPGGGHGNLLQYSCLENPMDRGAWQGTVHNFGKSWIRLRSPSTHAQTFSEHLCVWYVLSP